MEKKNEWGKGKNREEKSRRGNRRRGEVIQGGEGKEEGISGGMTGGKKTKQKKTLGKADASICAPACLLGRRYCDW